MERIIFQSQGFWLTGAAVMLHCIVSIHVSVRPEDISQKTLQQLHLYVSQCLVPGHVQALKQLKYSMPFMLEMAFTLPSCVLQPASLVRIFSRICILSLFFHCLALQRAADSTFIILLQINSRCHNSTTTFSRTHVPFQASFSSVACKMRGSIFELLTTRECWTAAVCSLGD